MNASTELVWRRPRRDELAPVWPMLVAAYRAADPNHPGDEAFFARSTTCDPRHRDGLWVVGEQDGACVTALRVVDREIVGTAGERLRLGGIANVGTHPAYGGRGFGSALLRQAIAVMEEEGYDLSLLYTGGHAFYERAGWRRVRLPKRFRDLPAPLEAPRAGGAYTVWEFDGGASDEAGDRAILREASALHEAAYGMLPGALVRDGAYWERWLSAYVLRSGKYRLAVASRARDAVRGGGETVAYLAVRAGERTAPTALRGDRPLLRDEGELAVVEGAARPGDEEALRELARYLGAGARCVSTPEVPWLVDAFTAFPGDSRAGDRDGGMVRALGGAPARTEWTYLLSALDGF